MIIFALLQDPRNLTIHFVWHYFVQLIIESQKYFVRNFLGLLLEESIQFFFFLLLLLLLLVVVVVVLVVVVVVVISTPFVFFTSAFTSNGKKSMFFLK